MQCLLTLLVWTALVQSLQNFLRYAHNASLVLTMLD